MSSGAFTNYHCLFQRLHRPSIMQMRAEDETDARIQFLECQYHDTGPLARGTQDCFKLI